MSATIHNVKGYDEYIKKMGDLSKSNEPTYCWYVGARLENGQSWCGDCRDTEPVIKDYLSSHKLKENINIVYTEIDREDFKGDNCKFRTDEEINLLKVPTLFCPSLQKKLVERKCMEISELDSFFADVKV